jgi:hypothetical protein
VATHRKTKLADEKKKKTKTNQKSQKTVPSGKNQKRELKTVTESENSSMVANWIHGG